MADYRVEDKVKFVYVGEIKHGEIVEAELYKNSDSTLTIRYTIVSSGKVFKNIHESDIIRKLDNFVSI